jgi:hypothetical protein
MPERPPLESFLQRPPLESFLVKDQPAEEPYIDDPTKGTYLEAVGRAFREFGTHFPADLAQLGRETWEGIKGVGKEIGAELAAGALTKNVGPQTETYKALQEKGVGGIAQDVWEGIKKFAADPSREFLHAFERHPAHLTADVALGATGAGKALQIPEALGAAGRVVEAAGAAGRTMETAGKIIDPVAVLAKTAEAGVGLGRGTAAGVQGTGTALREAQAAGRAGGEAKQAFQEAFHQDVPFEAQPAVQQMRAANDAEFNKVTAARPNKPDLPLNGIDKARIDAQQHFKFRASITNPQAREYWLKLTQMLQDLKTKPPQYRSAEGLESFKLQMENEARDPKYRGMNLRGEGDAVRADINKAIDKTIETGDSTYHGMKQGREAANKVVDDVETALTTDPHVNIGTKIAQVRKILKRELGSGYNDPKKVAEFLDKHGAPHLFERMAGQALRGYAPAGFLGKVWKRLLEYGAAGAGYGAVTHGGGIKASLAALAKTGGVAMGASPHVMGNVMRGAGTAGRYAAPVVGAARGAYQGSSIIDYANKLDPRQIVQQNAQDMLRDKKDYDLTGNELRVLRRATRKDTSAAVLQEAHQIMQEHSRKENIKASEQLRHSQGYKRATHQAPEREKPAYVPYGRPWFGAGEPSKEFHIGPQPFGTGAYQPSSYGGVQE